MAADSPGALDRRRLLQLGGAAVGASTLGRSTGTAEAFAAATAEPVSMAMHIHSSFSEGTASMDAHLDQARQLGVDVIWWTDHDFRQSAHGYRQAIEFDGASEPADAWALTWEGATAGAVSNAAHTFVTSPNSSGSAGGGSMRTQVRSAPGPEWGTYLVEAKSQNFMYSTSYADTTVSIDVRPQRLDADGRLLVEIGSSYRPASGGRPAGLYRIQYRIGDEEGYSLEEEGLLGVVGVPAGAAERFQRLALRPRRDHARLWPDTVADDASLWRIRFGVRSRNGATVVGHFDRLRFERDRATSADGAALLLRTVEQYRSRYPDVSQFAASEVSLVLHLNSFGGDGTLPTYDSPVSVKDSSVRAQRDMVAFLRSHGATVCINHPLPGGPDGATDLARRLIRHDGMGAQVIEIGTGADVDTLAKAFDAAARNAVFLTANGSSDDHDGQDWLSGQRWLTRVWSPTRRRQDLCAALEAGRAWFYDPLWWDGLLDLQIDGTTTMGGVHFTAHSSVELEITATALPRDSTLEVVVGHCDLAGAGQPTPRNRSIVVPAADIVAGTWSRTMSRHAGVYVRAAVRRDGGEIIGFSNPVWVLPPSRRKDVVVPAARR